MSSLEGYSHFFKDLKFKRRGGIKSGSCTDVFYCSSSGYEVLQTCRSALQFAIVAASLCWSINTILISITFLYAYYCSCLYIFGLPQQNLYYVTLLVIWKVHWFKHSVKSSSLGNVLKKVHTESSYLVSNSNRTVYKNSTQRRLSLLC